VTCLDNEKKWESSLSHRFSPDDSPVIFRVEGQPVHLTGSFERFDDVFSEATDSGEEEHEQDAPAEEEKTELPLHAKKHPRPSAEKATDSGDKKASKSKKARTADSGGQQASRSAEKIELPEPPVVISKPPEGTSSMRKAWRVKPQNDEGILVPKPKEVTRSTGVIVCDHVIGKGPEPKLGAEIRLIYEGMFPNGHVFDSSLKRTKPFKFRLGTGQVIRGLDLGLEGMRIGGSREITIPPALG
jgi:FKBP-type peptidyl-prolyl cis-trans isomerase